MNYFPNNLQYLRKQFGQTQAQLALQLNVSANTVGNYEAGKTEPEIKDLIFLSEFFSISLDLLIKWDLKNGNLITEEHVRYFEKNGNLNGKPIGNPNTLVIKDYPENSGISTMVREPEESANWGLLTLISKIGENVDQVRVLAEKTLKKVSEEGK